MTPHTRNYLNRFRRRPSGVVIGRRFDGKPLVFPWPQPWVGHVLIAGLIGSGKSTYLNALIGGAAADPDTAVIGTDLKGGIELRPWEPRMSGLATTPVEATNQLWQLSRAARERMAIVVANGADKWDIADGPIILAVYDEIAELAAIDGDAIGAYLADPVNNRLGDAKEDRKIRLGLLSSITRLCRALGITVVCSTQHPLAEIVPTDLRSQLSVRIAGRVTGREQIDVALGEGMSHHIAPDAISVDEPGVAHVLGLPDCPIPTRCRSTWADKDEIRARAAATAHLAYPAHQLLPPLPAVTAPNVIALGRGNDDTNELELGPAAGPRKRKRRKRRKAAAEITDHQLTEEMEALNELEPLPH